MKGASCEMGIVIAILITAQITSILVYCIMRDSINKKTEVIKNELKISYEKLYYKKEDKLKCYYTHLIENEIQKNKDNLKFERNRYDKMLMEANEIAQRDKQLLMMKFRQSRSK